MKLRKLLLVPGLIGLILTQGHAYGAVTANQARTPDAEQVESKEQSNARARVNRGRQATLARPGSTSTVRTSAATGGQSKSTSGSTPSARVASTQAAASPGQLSTREIYRRGYLAGYRTATQRFQGQSRSDVFIPEGPQPLSLAALLVGESRMAGGGATKLRVLPGYKLNDQFSLGAQFGIRSGFGNPDTARNTTRAEDGRLILRHSGLPIGKMITFAPSAEAALPISEISRSEETLITRLSAVPRLNFDFSHIGAKGLSAYTRVWLNKGFHTSGVSRTAEPGSNVTFTFAPEAGLGFSPADSVSLASGMYIGRNWKYDASTSDDYEIYEELGFNVSKGFSLALGHSSSGTPADGLTLGSQRTSKVYSTFTYSF